MRLIPCGAPGRTCRRAPTSLADPCEVSWAGQLNDDGSATTWCGPTAPAFHKSNWVQIMPGKGWNCLLRLYGPLEPSLDESWQAGEFEEAK